MENTRPIENDYAKLSALSLAISKSRNPGRAAVLDERLRAALNLEKSGLAGSHVTMGSIVTISDEDSGESFTYRLVFPAEADIMDGRISVLTPLGSGLLGRREGESFVYDSPGGKMRVRVIKVVREA